MKIRIYSLIAFFALLNLSFAHPALAGSILAWGEQVVDSIELDQKDHIAISAGERHSLVLIGQPCLYVLAGDLNDDCKVDFSDFALLAANWLIDCNIDPNDPACVPK